jgi:hypothetical protein
MERVYDWKEWTNEVRKVTMNESERHQEQKRNEVKRKYMGSL